MTHLSLSQDVVQLNEHTAQFTITLHNNSSKTLSNWELIFSITRFLKSNSISKGKLSQLGSLCSVTELPELAIDESLSFTLEMETPPLRLQCDTILEAYVDINGERLDIEITPADIDSAYNEPTKVPEVKASAMGLIPKPNELTLLEGDLKLEDVCHYRVESDAAEPSVAWLKQAASHIQFEQSENDAQLVFAVLDNLDVGAYQLEVTHDQITLNACDSEGFRNATASLVQLLGSSNTSGAY